METAPDLSKNMVEINLTGSVTVNQAQPDLTMYMRVLDTAGDPTSGENHVD